MKVLDGIAPYLMIAGGLVLLFSPAGDGHVELVGTAALGAGGLATLIARWARRTTT